MQRATTANQHSCHTNLKADRVVKRAAAGSVNEASAAGRAVHFPQESTWQTGTVVCTCMLCKISKAFLIQSAIAVLLLVTYFSYFPFSSHSVREIWSVLGFKCMKVRFSVVTGRVCVSGFVRLHHWECDDGRSKDGQHFLSTCAYECKVLLFESKNSKVKNCLWFSHFLS